MKRPGYILYLLIGAIIIVSCKSEVPEIAAFADTVEVPLLTGEDATVVYSDSAKIKVKLITPMLKQFIPEGGEPYYEFPEGIEIHVYNDLEAIESKIKAGYAILYYEKEFCTATNNVFMESLADSSSLETEAADWDMAAKTIVSNKFTTVTTKDGVFYGNNGFNAKQDFSEWKLIGSSGNINVQDELQ